VSLVARHRHIGISRAVLLVFLVSGSPYLIACSSYSEPKPMAQEFTIKVANAEKPVPGLRIELSTDSDNYGQSQTASVLTTDASGMSTFRNVKPGLYFVGVSHPAVSVSEEIRVLPHPAKDTPREISFEWPARTFLHVASVSGVVNGHTRTDRGLGADLKQPVYRAVSGAKLTLSKLISNDAVASDITHDSGDFYLGGVSAGDYFLRVQTQKDGGMGWFYPDGYIPITVDPSSKVQSLNLFLDDAICGELGYENRAPQ